MHRRHPGGDPHVNTISIPSRKNLQVFSGRAYPELAEEIAKYLGTSLTPQSAYDFANGEIFVRFEESVRGSDAFVIQSSRAPINTLADGTRCIMIDALKRASAKRITVVLPFYPYARQDKKHRGREPISARLVADLLQAPPALTGSMTVDLHTDQIQGFFDGPVDHLFAQRLLADYVATSYAGAGHHRGRPGLRPGASGRALGRPAGRRPAGVHPQDPRPAHAEPGGHQPRRR